MSKTAIYQAYLAEFKKTNAPEITSDMDKQFLQAEQGAEIISRSPKFWDCPVVVKKLKDGRIAECCKGAWENPVALFESETAWREHRQPMSFNVYFEQW